MSLEKLKTRKELTLLTDSMRKEGRTIVFTNGCFDLLHVGHVRLLEAAKKMGDILVVGINSDASVKRYKGPERPVVNERDRAEVLSALQCIDYLVIFDEDTPVATIGCLKPHIHVKGGDYDIKKVPEAQIVESYGGMLRTFPVQAGHSTTGLIEKASRPAS
jgi:rfaE bifunctional protein nucleotidyltransferase chain/domain